MARDRHQAGDLVCHGGRHEIVDVSIGEYCTRSVRTASAQDTLRETAQRMSSAGVGSIVVTARDQVVGIVTDRDVALEVLVRQRDPDETRVGELLESKPAIVDHEDSPLRVAAGMMRRHGLRRLPVLDEKEHLVRIITSDRLLGLVGRELCGLTDVVDSQHAGEIFQGGCPKGSGAGESRT